MSSGALKSRTSPVHRAAGLKALPLSSPPQLLPTKHKNLEMSFSSNIGAFETINDKVLRELNERTARAVISSGTATSPHTGPRMSASFKQRNIFDTPSSQPRSDSNSRGAHTLQSAQTRYQANPLSSRAKLNETISRMQRLTRRADKFKMAPRPLSSEPVQSEQASAVGESFSPMSSPIKRPLDWTPAQEFTQNFAPVLKAAPTPISGSLQNASPHKLGSHRAVPPAQTQSPVPPSTPVKPFRFSSYSDTPRPTVTPKFSTGLQPSFARPTVSSQSASIRPSFARATASSRAAALSAKSMPTSSMVGSMATKRQAQDPAASAPQIKRARVYSNQENIVPSYARPTLASSRRVFGSNTNLANKTKPQSQANKPALNSKPGHTTNSTTITKPNNGAAATFPQSAVPFKPASSAIQNTLAVSPQPVASTTQTIPSTPEMQRCPANPHFESDTASSGFPSVQIKGSSTDISSDRAGCAELETASTSKRSSRQFVEINLPPQADPSFNSGLRRSPRLALRWA